jgi:cytochrome c oxidase subunit II
MDFFQQSSNFVAGVDFAFYFIFGISIFFLIAITAVMLFFVRNYRRSKNPKATQIKEKLWLELTWFFVPLVLVIFMFYYGYVAYSPGSKAPKDAMVVKTIGKMWQWSFEYPNGKESRELYLPKNKAVKLELTSLDVIHGFSIPAFRIKEDAVPGKKNSIWFVPQELGDFEIFCSYYCGLNHSYMGSKVVVENQQDFDKWYANYTPKKAEPEGLVLIKNNACTGCHSIDGAKGVAPTFKGLFGSKRLVTAGGADKEMVADELYIRRSILDPGSEVVKGYTNGVMKSYRGVVKNADIKKITEYLKTIK